MTDIKLKVNQKIELIDNHNTYKSNIQDVRDDCILIDMPVSGNKYYTMHSGSTIEYFITNENEIFKCQSTVLGNRKDGNVFLVILSNPKLVDRVQRREYFRLPISIALKYYILKDYESNYSLKAIFNTNIMNKLKETFSVDISGGGAKIITSEICPKGTKVLLYMELPEKVIAIASAIRSDLIEYDRNYKTALKFELLSEVDRDRIIRFVFSKHREQTKLLKKE
jgi:c-di-GMP-binding flagellar brake protein YcgR